MKTTISADLRTNIAILNLLAIVPLLPITNSSLVSATVGQNSFFTIFGYTSPGAYVEMYGSGVYQKNIADNSGYFEYSEVILPKHIRDLCLSAQDTASRPTPPSCFSLPPIDNQHRRIGPILIAPSLTIAKNNLKPGEANSISGETIPKSNIKIKIFPQYTSSPAFPKPAFAASPVFILETISDPKGHYSLFLPSNHANSYLINTQSQYKENPTPPSFQVSYSLPSYSLTMLQLYPLLLPLLFFQILVIAVLLFIRRRQVQSRALAIYQKSLSIPKRSLIRYPNSLWPRS